MDTQELKEKFGIFMSSEIMQLQSKYPLGSDYFSFCANQDPNFIDDVLVSIGPILNESKIFTLTKIKTLDIFIAMVEPTTQAHVVRHRYERSTGSHSATKTFHWSEVPRDSKGFLEFAISLSVETLREVAPMYKLDPQMSSCIEKHFSVAESLNSQSLLSDTVQIENVLTDEVHIHIKLTGQQFGVESEFVENGELVEAINSVLSAENIGAVDGSEIGFGFETIFCVGPNANAIFDSLTTRFSDRIPSGSYAELKIDGRTERRELPMTSSSP